MDESDLPVKEGDVVSIEVIIRTVCKRGAESAYTSERKLQRLGFTVPSTGGLSIPARTHLGCLRCGHRPPTPTPQKICKNN